MNWIILNVFKVNMDQKIFDDLSNWKKIQRVIHIDFI